MIVRNVLSEAQLLSMTRRLERTLEYQCRLLTLAIGLGGSRVRAKMSEVEGKNGNGTVGSTRAIWKDGARDFRQQAIDCRIIERDYEKLALICI